TGRPRRSGAAVLRGDLGEGAARARRPRPPRIRGAAPGAALRRPDQQPRLLAVVPVAEAGEGVLPAHFRPVQPERGVPALQGLREVQGPAPAVVAERLVRAAVP